MKISCVAIRGANGRNAKGACHNGQMYDPLFKKTLFFSIHKPNWTLTPRYKSYTNGYGSGSVVRLPLATFERSVEWDSMRLGPIVCMRINSCHLASEPANTSLSIAVIIVNNLFPFHVES